MDEHERRCRVSLRAALSGPRAQRVQSGARGGGRRDLDEIRKIQTSSPTRHSRRFVERGFALPDVQIAGGGLSMTAVARSSRALFDTSETRIGGEVLRDERAAHDRIAVKRAIAVPA